MAFLIPAAMALGGAALGYMGSKETADAAREANEANEAQFYGPGLGAVPGLLSAARDIYGRGGFAPTAHPLELLGRQNQLGYADQVAPGLVNQAQQSWVSGLDPGLDPYVGHLIQAGHNDLVQDYQRNVLPSITNAAQAVGGYGGSRQGVAEGIASEGLLEAQGDLSARLLSQAYGQRLGQQRAAWGVTPSMLASGLFPSSVQQQVGAQYRDDQAQPAQNLAGYAGMVNPYVAASAGSSAQPVTPVTPGILEGAAAGYQTGKNLNWYP